MEPLKYKISDLSLKITDEGRMGKERIASLNGIFFSIFALFVSVGAIIFSIFLQRDLPFIQIQNQNQLLVNKFEE